MGAYKTLCCNLGLVAWLSAASSAFGATWSVTERDQNLVVASDHPETAFVLFPGAYVRADQYVELASRIVDRSNGRIAVVVAHFTANFANPIEAGSRVQTALDLLAQAGVDAPADHTFVGGHSHGGMIASDLPDSMGLKGLVLLASYLPRTVFIGKSLETYAKPVLTLGGELDGLTGINYVARDAVTLATLAQSNRALLTSKPVILVRGANHMQFADGAPLAGDLAGPSATLAQAHDAMALAIVSFIDGQSTSSELKVAAQLKTLAQVQSTFSLLAPYFRTWNQDGDLCAKLQRQAAPLTEDSWAKLAVDQKVYRTKGEFFAWLFDKSSVQSQNDGHAVLHLPVYVETAPNITDISKDAYVSSEVVACKMRTQEKLVSEAGAQASGTAQNCAELNASVISSALALVTDPMQRQRLARLYGEPTSWTMATQEVSGSHDVTFGPFRIVSSEKSTGQDWVAGTFGLSRQNGQWTLTTAEVQTASDTAISLFAGANYCKVIEPLRIVEWATLFGLKSE